MLERGLARGRRRRGPSRAARRPTSREHVELAYATTAYGAQGSTVPTAHVLVGEHTGAASAYVGMTRGRERNVAHLVAESVDDARRQWVEVFGRDRADLGPAHAARLAAEAIDRYGPTAPTRRPGTSATGTDLADREDDFGYRPPTQAPGRPELLRTWRIGRPCGAPSWHDATGTRRH